MSEFQYYEFQKVDGRLSEKEMQELRAFSTSARITPASFINEYHFGSFKGNAVSRVVTEAKPRTVTELL